MKLTTERIDLRTIEPDDLDGLIALTRDRPDMDDAFPFSLLRELIVGKHFEPEDVSGNQSECCLLITGKTGAVMGCIAYFKARYGLEGLELAYHLFHPDFRGKGYMQEAVETVKKHLFETKNVSQLHINVIEGNTASRNVAERCGFIFDGAMTRAVSVAGQWKDIEMFTATRVRHN